MKKKIGYLILIILAIMQFKRIDKTNPPIVASEDFFNVNQAPTETEVIIKTACYDCHSHHSVYPWYSNLAPVSWWLEDHIKEGRSHLNFSTWSQLENSKKIQALEECVEVIEGKEMPMLPYMIAHGDAWVNDEQRTILAEYFRSLR